AMAEIGDENVGAFGKTDALKRRPRRLGELRVAARVAPEAERMAGMRLDGERDIVERGEVEKQRGDLERSRQPELAAAVDRQSGDVHPVETDAPGVGREFAG